jgi:hypothetical protein
MQIVAPWGQSSNIVPSIRTPIFCLISIPSNFIFPACACAVNLQNHPYQQNYKRTNLDSFILHLAQFHQLFLVQVAVMFHRFSFVSTSDRLHVGLRIVRVVRRWNEITLAKRGHTSFVRLYVVVLLMRQRCYIGEPYCQVEKMLIS